MYIKLGRKLVPGLKSDEPLEVDRFSAALKRLLTSPVLAGVNADSLAAAGEWEEFCDNFFRTYQSQALAEAGEDI